MTDLSRLRDLITVPQRTAEEDLRHLLLSLVEMLDQLDMWLAGRDAEPDPTTAPAEDAARLHLLRRRLRSVLLESGVTPCSATGMQVDLRRHQVLEQRHVDGCAPESIVEVVRCGYLWNDQLLRSARVVVAGEPEAGTPPQGGAG